MQNSIAIKELPRIKWHPIKWENHSWWQQWENKSKTPKDEEINRQNGVAAAKATKIKIDPKDMKW